MAFNRLMLTTIGKTLYAKAQQGKLLKFTRVGIGEGDIGSGSLINRTALISPKLSLLIDTIQIANETESAIIVTLSNSELTEGFYFREIGIFAQDPDTLEEKLYLYDNAGTDGELIPDNQSGVQVNERLKFLILLENVTEVSFNASGNPIYLGLDDIDDTVISESSLWSSEKTNSEISAAITTAAADATTKANTAAAASIPLTQKGAAGGVAELDSGAKIPSAQLPSYVDDVLEYANLAAFPATGEGGKIYVALDTNLSYRWGGSAYVEISPSIALGETSSTAYRGDRGKTAYDHSQTTGNPHGATAADVGAAAAVHSHSGYVQGLTFTGVAVTATSFVSNATYTNWGYRATVALTGVTADMTPSVVFAPDDATGGVLAPVAACYAGGVYLYANAVPGANLTIPTITCTKEVA